MAEMVPHGRPKVNRGHGSTDHSRPLLRHMDEKQRSAVFTLFLQAVRQGQTAPGGEERSR